jgi:hypothetical protein
MKVLSIAELIELAEKEGYLQKGYRFASADGQFFESRNSAIDVGQRKGIDAYQFSRDGKVEDVFREGKRLEGFQPVTEEAPLTQDQKEKSETSSPTEAENEENAEGHE